MARNHRYFHSECQRCSTPEWIENFACLWELSSSQYSGRLCADLLPGSHLSIRCESKTKLCGAHPPGTRNHVTGNNFFSLCVAGLDGISGRAFIEIKVSRSQTITPGTDIKHCNPDSY